MFNDFNYLSFASASSLSLFGSQWTYDPCKLATQGCLLPRGKNVVSVFNAKGPPVPIPNTEVKLCSAENTCLETDRENRSTLTQPDRAAAKLQRKVAFCRKAKM